MTPVSRPMSNVRKVLRNIAAVILLLIGIVGGFIPILQGWVFVIAAFAVADFERKHALMRWFLSRKLTRKVLGPKLIAKLMALDPARKRRLEQQRGQPPSEVARGLTPSEPSANLPASKPESEP